MSHYFGMVHSIISSISSVLQSKIEDKRSGKKNICTRLFFIFFEGVFSQGYRLLTSSKAEGKRVSFFREQPTLSM